ncbi:hypothetical protein GCM10011354_01000 [Egicoccus halophilus]|uniref:Uncharacterized protein n=1 Tax=Egicoccus halophilus TaxID=1670830 RepID=A0A8J3A4W6_9ACTN|nr:hypothetical protein GCM10011354_01000 [Egicoccus halophilus]
MTGSRSDGGSIRQARRIHGMADMSMRGSIGPPDGGVSMPYRCGTAPTLAVDDVPATVACPRSPEGGHRTGTSPTLRLGWWVLSAGVEVLRLRVVHDPIDVAHPAARVVGVVSGR